MFVAIISIIEKKNSIERVFYPSFPSQNSNINGEMYAFYNKKKHMNCKLTKQGEKKILTYTHIYKQRAKSIIGFYASSILLFVSTMAL